jgi:UDP-glucose 4-epimerase
MESIMTSYVLVTGGTGFIGSHTTVALQQAGHNVIVLDNLCNSEEDVLDRIATATGERPLFVRGDVRDGTLLTRLFDDHDIQAVLHFAGLKAVGESNSRPLAYYDNNVNGSARLLEAMQSAGVKTFVFSSSATVYGDPERLPLTEDHPRRATNPYGNTKIVVEDVMESLYRSESGWKMARLRYFNPVGSHPSGLLGEAPRGVPNNLMPYVAQVATGERKCLHIFGNDYETPDGTGIRDYIHVMDLAEGHVHALHHCSQQDSEMLTVNLGTGQGHTVLDMVRAFERACGRRLPYEFLPRRPGDIAACWAETSHAERQLGWKAQRCVEAMCEDAWRWTLQRQKTGSTRAATV